MTQPPQHPSQPLEPYQADEAEESSERMDGAAWEDGAELSLADAAAPSQAERIDGKRLLNWLQPARSEVERAQDSERYFWLKAMVLVGFFAAIVAAGIVRVQHTTGGVRVAYELVKTNDELRIKLESNRRLEAVLTGLKNPNALRREAGDKFEMHAPAAAEVLEVD